MTQEERWLSNWKEIVDFIEANKRRPSKYVPEEKLMHNWWKHQQKLMNAGALKEKRMEKFKELVEMGRSIRGLISFSECGRFLQAVLPARLHGLRAGAEGSLGQRPNVPEAGII